MPSLTDYLVAPWRILRFLIGSGDPTIADPRITPHVNQVAAGALATTTAPAQNALPQGAICGYHASGDEIIHVCSFAGYEMPSFIFAACIFIFGFFVIASIRLIQKCQRVSEIIGHLDAQFSHLKFESKEKLTPNDLEKIASVMQKYAIVRHSWEVFEESLLYDGDDHYRTVPSDKIFTRQELIEEPVDSSFYSNVPGILTGLGLLMTFIAILEGLSHVSVTQNLDVKGIGGLINGLSGKFASSVIAVSCSVAFVFVERFALSLPNKTYRHLIRLLDKRFHHRTTAQLIHRLLLDVEGGRKLGRSPKP